MREVAGRAVCTKVRIAERCDGHDVVVEHVGTARTPAELAVLMARVRRRMQEGKGVFDLGEFDAIDEGILGRPALITSER